MLGQMNFNGQGGKEDFAEARRQSLTLPRTLTLGLSLSLTLTLTLTSTRALAPNPSPAPHQARRPTGCSVPCHSMGSTEERSGRPWSSFIEETTPSGLWYAAS